RRPAGLEGSELGVAVVETDDEPLVAEPPEIPSSLALQGFDGVRAYSSAPEASRSLLESTLGFKPSDDRPEWEVRGAQRGSFYLYDEPQAERGLMGAGSVHHVAWASPMEEHAAWQRRVAEAGAPPTPVIHRFYLRSIYFPEPTR